MGLDLKSAQLMVHCARLGSIGKAADALNITQPAAARLLLRLEQRLGVTLFERSAKGVSLTHYGKALVPHAALVASEAALADEVVAQMRGSARGVPLPHRHYRFLNRRIDLPLHPTWADWLWDRALRRREAVALETYGLDGGAYRCAPHPERLRADISAAVASGALAVDPPAGAPERALAA